MSSRENSPGGHENGSDRRSAEENSPSIEDSHSVREEEETRRSRSRSKSRSRSASYSRRRRSYSRSRSRSRSRRYRRHSRSRSRSPRHRRYSRSRSRSRSYSPRHSYSPQYSPRRSSYYGRDDKYRYGSGKGRRDYYYSRSYDRSPVSHSGRHFGNRDNPEPSRCLGVFGLSLYTQERDLRDVFGKYGPIEDVQVVYDAQSGRSRGFAFVYFEETEDAKMAKDRCNGQEIDGRKIRVDFSITQRAHTPTPGIYMGKPTYSKYRDGGYRDRGYRGHSPYYSSRHRYSRSRSRSYDYY